MIKTTLKIDGMACSMCEAHMNDLIRKVAKVKKVTSSAKAGETVVISEEELDMPVPPLPDNWQGRQFLCPYPVNVVKYDIRMKNKGGRSENV